jgi:Cephalosporin hydroxylase
MPAPLGYSALCLDRQLEPAAAFRTQLDQIRSLVDEPGNLTVLQGLQLYALALEYRPDIIIELGRGYGNSACVFASAIIANGHGRLVSFDLDTLWHKLTVPKLHASSLATLAPLVDARTQDIATVDFKQLTRDAQKILVFWDAHGWQAADGVLCRLLPAIADRDHIVACHDVTDSRHIDVPRSYDGQFFWRGPELKEVSARYNIGWINTQEPQFLPLVDFLWRNDCDLRSADEDLAVWRRDHGVRQAEIDKTLGPELFAPGCHWAYFSLNDARAPLTFPVQAPRGSRTQQRSLARWVLARLASNITG